MMGKKSLKQVVYPDLTTSANVQPISKGGTGAITKQQALINLGMIDRVQLGIKGGVAVTSDSAKIPSEILPVGAVDADILSLDGPNMVLADTEYVYTITDYDYKKAYTISVINGTVSQENDKIFVRTAATPGLLTLTVNGILHRAEIHVPEVSVIKPVIISPSNDSNNISKTPTLTANVFATTGGDDVHVMTDWEVCSAPNGNGTVAWSSYADSVNKVAVSISGLNNMTTYYARCRYRGSKTEWSPWSDDAKFTTTGVQTAGWKYWRNVAISKGGLRIVAVPANGYIHVSQDGGTTWMECTSAGSRNWSGLAISGDGSRIIAGCDSADEYIYTSSDGGETWIQRTNIGTGNWNSISCSTDGLCVLAAAFNGFVRTSSDGGMTWSAAKINSLYWKAAKVTTDGKRMVVSASDGQTWYSADNGVTWTNANVNISFLDFVISNNGLEIVGITDTLIFKSINGGVTWQQLTQPSDRHWRGITSSDDLGFLNTVDYGGWVYASSNGGGAWQYRTGAGIRNWTAIDMSLDGQKVVAVTAPGYIYTSEDWGVTWTVR